MRAISFKILVLGTLCATSWAHPRPSAPAKASKMQHAAAAKKAAVSARKTESAKTHGAGRKAAEERKVAEEKSSKTSRRGSAAARVHAHEAKLVPVKGKKAAPGKGKRQAELREARAVPERAPAAAPEARAEAPVEAAEPKVHHDRKQHLGAPPTSGQADAGVMAESGGEPRKASAEDFRTTTPAEAKAAANIEAKVKMPAAVKVSSPTVPVRVVPTTGLLKKETKPAAPAALVQEGVLEPDQPVLYDKRGRLIVPPAMKGTHEILVHQNVMADEDGLARVQDDEDLERLRASKQLVAIPVGQGLLADERLPENRRYTRPWTAQFLAGLARAHYQRFHTALQVNSAVRTVAFQQQLMRTNGNAAPPTGETASPHLTGQAVDLAKKGLSMAEIAWMRGYLGPLMRDGKVDVEEEFQQACFHISVYKKYLPSVAPKKVLVAAHVAGAGVAGMR